MVLSTDRYTYNPRNRLPTPPMNYPSSWPTANPARPEAVHTRITEQQKHDLYNRNITTRELAAVLDVNEKYLSSRFPGKVTVASAERKVLVAVRKEYKATIATEVLMGKYTVRQAANVAHVSLNTMFRFVRRAKDLHPELKETYQASLRQRTSAPNIAVANIPPPTR